MSFSQSPTSDLVEQYAIKDKRLIDVEALAQREFRYTRIATEEAIYLANDPQRRDQALSKLYSQKSGQQFQGTIDPQAIVQTNRGRSPHAYLAWIDDGLGKPVRTYDDHVLRAHLAFAGALVFQEFIKQVELYHFPDFQRAVNRRVTELNTKLSQELKETERAMASNQPYWAQYCRYDHSDTNSSIPPTFATEVSMRRCSPVKPTPEQIEATITNPLASQIYRYYYKSTADGEDCIWRFKGVEMTAGGALYGIQMRFKKDAVGLVPHDESAFRDLMKNSYRYGEAIEKEDDADRLAYLH
ncbi:hypothetical protein C8Q75DRAFT_504945 [Abortiporus biennis]|nr:hypothetical protein C8Q75DRAFT_504945 [Abortiporus biennis]